MPFVLGVGNGGKLRAARRDPRPQTGPVHVHTRRTLRPITIEMSQVTAGQRTLQKMKLPEAEVKRVNRFQERTEKRIRSTDERQRNVKKPSQKKPFEYDGVTPVREKDRDIKKPQDEKQKPPAKERPKKEKPRVRPVKEKSKKEKPATKEPAKKKPTKRTRKG